MRLGREGAIAIVDHQSVHTTLCAAQPAVEIAVAVEVGQGCGDCGGKRVTVEGPGVIKGQGAGAIVDQDSGTTAVSQQEIKVPVAVEITERTTGLGA